MIYVTCDQRKFGSLNSVLRNFEKWTTINNQDNK